jgi:hypothetical protein
MTTNEIDNYESHESWLARTIAELEDMSGLPHDPPPRNLPPLPWWKDENRINGEAARILEALAFAWGVIKALTRDTLRKLFRNPYVVAVFVLAALFLTGYALAKL